MSTSHSISRTVRVRKNADYVPISNRGPRDARLSWGARGILVYLLTKPDNWNPTVEDLVRQTKEGVTAVKAMFEELKTCGYLKRECVRGELGRFVWKTTLYENAQDVDFSTRKKTRKKRRAKAAAVAVASGENEGEVDVEAEVEAEARGPSAGELDLDRGAAFFAPSVGFPSMVKPSDGSPLDGAAGDIRSNQKKYREEVLRDETWREAPAPPKARKVSISVSSTADAPLLPTMSPEIAAVARSLCRVCGTSPERLRPVEWLKLQMSLDSIIEQSPDIDIGQLPAEVERRFSAPHFTLPTLPFLDQVGHWWGRQAAQIEHHQKRSFYVGKMSFLSPRQHAADSREAVLRAELGADYPY